MRKDRLGFGKHVVVFLISVVFALGLLILAAFTPQEYIVANLWESVDHLGMEGIMPYMSDYSDSSSLDNFTDLLMLLETATTNDQYLGSVLTNPIYVYSYENAEMIRLLENYLNGMPHESVGYYVRYWMGFRVILRVLLAFLNYFQIRRYIAVAFFALLAAVMCSIARHIDTKLAFLFAISIILVKPHIIVNCMQYSCCFLIMFIAMLLVPWIHRHRKYETLFFMEIGIITMYLDFYTVPLITMGFPLVYLCALRVQDGEVISVRGIMKDMLSWFAGYGLMWIAKLVLTTALTSINALANGISAFFDRVGITKDPELEAYYSLSLAFERLKIAIFCDEEGAWIYLLTVAAAVCCTVVFCIIKKVRMGTFVSNWVFVFVALLPILWFMVTAQPIAIHYFAQYRTIALTYWALGAYVFFLFCNRGKEQSI